MGRSGRDGLSRYVSRCDGMLDGKFAKNYALLDNLCQASVLEVNDITLHRTTEARHTYVHITLHCTAGTEYIPTWLGHVLIALEGEPDQDY